MLRLHWSRLFHERILAFEREDGLSGHAGLRLFPATIGAVAVICEMDEVLKVGGVSFRG